MVLSGCFACSRPGSDAKPAAYDSDITWNLLSFEPLAALRNRKLGVALLNDGEASLEKQSMCVCVSRKQEHQCLDHAACKGNFLKG